MTRFSLTTLTLAGLGLGISVGLFFGEYAENLQPLGDGFIMLLQMAVLPYFLITLILGLGTIDLDTAKALGIRGAAVLGLLWLMCFIVIFALPLSFPDLETASFFSTSSVQSQQELNFLKLYIPANPFNTLSEGILPGVVIFGLSMGIALIGVPNKSALVDALTSMQSALIRITQFVVQLTPIGVFALAAAAAGTMTVEEFGRLQVYLIAYTVGAMLLTFWFIPMLIAVLTPFTYREVFKAAKDPLVTGFTTGNLLVVLPLLTERIKQLFHDRAVGDEHTDSLVGITVPIGYPFPDIGTLLIMLFVPFAAWFSGNPMSLEDYPQFAVVGFFSFFGSVEIGMPFLLDQLRVPKDMFELYLMTLVYISRFATLVAVAHVTGLAILATCAVSRLISTNVRKLVVFAAVSLVLVVVSVGTTRVLLGIVVDANYTKDTLVTSMRWYGDAPPAKVLEDIPERPGPELARDQLLIDAIRERGVLRVGYVKDALPYSFFNNREELVGLDVEMAHRLATDLGVQLEFVPFTYATLKDQIQNRHFDIAMSGILATPGSAAYLSLTKPYMEVNLAIVVEDHRRAEFDRIEKIEEKAFIKVHVLGEDYLSRSIEKLHPNVQTIPVESPELFFEGGFLESDGLVMNAEAGSTWTLLNPGFTVVVPQPASGAIPLAYAIASRDDSMQDFVNRWIDYHKSQGTIDRLYNHYILGEQADEAEPRWSVIRNVLGWVD